VYKIPLPYSDLDYYFTYAGKAHPELAVKDNELIITYVVRPQTHSPGLYILASGVGTCLRIGALAVLYIVTASSYQCDCSSPLLCGLLLAAGQHIW
jgi:hypothetical protein